jgi:hypothetical protein
MNKAHLAHLAPLTPPRMTHVTMRLPQDILDFYKRFRNPSAEMREVLIAYARERTGIA